MGKDCFRIVTLVPPSISDRDGHSALWEETMFGSIADLSPASILLRISKINLFTSVCS